MNHKKKISGRPPRHQPCKLQEVHMEYTEADLPLNLHHGEILTLADGTTVRFESNGEAKDVFLSDDFSPTVELFPAQEYTFETGGNNYKLSAEFSDNILVEKL